MSRHAKLISLEKFKELTRELINDEEFPYNFPPKIEKDLSKVNFDFENYNLGKADPMYEEEYDSDFNGYCGYPCGYEILPNGLPVLFVNAGGDWENPICFVIYYDGKELRAYIPSDGNIWNKKEKCAYGSEDNIDDDFDFDNLPEGNPELIRNDVMNRIKIV
jgi:hypothetical protein